LMKLTKFRTNFGLAYIKRLFNGYIPSSFSFLIASFRAYVGIFNS